MSEFLIEPFTITSENTGRTLAWWVRHYLPTNSWSQVRKLIEQRHVKISGSVCMDHARRVKTGETVEMLARPAPTIRGESPKNLTIRHLDDHLVVIEKASGINTVRHPAELQWGEERRKLAPTLQDITQWAIAEELGRDAKSLPPLRIVQRLDKDTSGLVVFARSVLAERLLGKQFHRHTVKRLYWTVVNGRFLPQTISSWLVRDRGDGRRGSGLEGVGKQAITHVTVLEKLPQHTVLQCKLETGRTHQIRIHLSESGHPVCGEKVYNRTVDGRELADPSNAPRLALHALELGFQHPESGEQIGWKMDLPKDLQGFLERIRGKENTN
ncbi:MAG: RluA family pseudouridine synthase [Zavarzinella sp.]